MIPDVGLGIRVEPKFLGYQSVNGRRFGIQCRISVDASALLDFVPLPVQFKPKGTFTIYPHPPFVVADQIDATLSANIDDFLVELPTPPLEMRGLTIGIDPRPQGNDKFLSVKTKLGPASGVSNAVNLKIVISCGLPVREFDFNGDLMLGEDPIGTVSGSLSPTKFTGTFRIPKDGTGSPIQAMVTATGDFTIDHDGLSGHAHAVFFEVIRQYADLLLRTDGSGRFDFNDAVTVGGFSASGGIEATFARQFKNLVVVASMMITVDGLDMFNFARVSVTTTIRDAQSIAVQWSALGMSDQFVMSLNGSLVDELRRELAARVPKGLQNLWNGAKDLDVFNRNSALRKGLAQLDVFNKNSDAAKELSHLQDVGNDLIKNIPGESTISKGLQQGGSDVDNYLQSHGVNIPGLGDRRWETKPGFFAPRESYSVSRMLVPLPLTGLLMAGTVATDNATLLARSQAFVAALQKLDFHEKPPREKHVSGSRRLSRQTELSVKCDRATLAPEGADDFVVALSLRCSGYQVRLSTQEPSQRSQGAEMKWAWIRLTNARGHAKGARSIEIHLPALNANQKYTYLDVTSLVRTRLQAILEQYLPDFSLGGPQHFYEKRLAVRNAADEPITVWVQGRTLTRDDKGSAWRWLPGDPSAHRAFKTVIPAHATRNLEEDIKIPLPKVSIGNIAGGGGFKFSTTSQIEHVPFAASRVRIWAETASGQQQTSHRDHDLWLVPENRHMKGEHAYIADQMALATYTFSFPAYDRELSERLVLFRNDTHEPLTISAAQYQTLLGGRAVWRALPALTLKPGSVHKLTEPGGEAVHATALRFVAEGADLLFDQYRQVPLYLVKEHGGSRTYRARSLGTYEQVFKDRLTLSRK